MIKKCPHCEFAPIQDQLICPSCGAELNENITQQIKEDQTKQPEVTEVVNDNINWSNYQEVSLGSVMDHFNEVIDEEEPELETDETPEETESDEETVQETVTKELDETPEVMVEVVEEAPIELEETMEEMPESETEAVEDELSDNPILAAYIRRHKEGLPEDELLAAIEENQAEKAEKDDELAEGVTETVSKEVDDLISEETPAVPTLEEAVEPAIVEEEPVKAKMVIIEKSAEKFVSSTEDSETKESAESEKIETVLATEEVVEEIIEPEMKEISEETLKEATEEPVVEEAIDSEIDKALSKISQFEETEVVEEATVPVEVAVDEVPVEAPMQEPVVTPTEEVPDSAEVIAPQAKKKSKKWLYALTAAGIVAVAGGGWMYYDAKQKAEAARQEQIRIDNVLSDAKEQALGFYVSADKTFIKSDKTLAMLKEIQESIAPYNEQEAYPEVEEIVKDVSVKLTQIAHLNQYFTEPLLVGNQLAEGIHIKDESPIEMENLSGEDAFSKLYNEGLQMGKIELQQVIAAKIAVENILQKYPDGKLQKDLTRKEFNAAKKQVTDLFDSSMKSVLEEKIAPVEKALVEREEQEEAARVAAAQKAAEEERLAQEREQAMLQQQQQQYNTGTEILSPSTPKNSNNQPIISSRQSDIDDVNNPGWAWAPGVYDRVINTVISRGYVVSGGFYLQPARIENGEGYYHLYATSNQSSLLSGMSESAMPFYLVTINAKTGYFRGNGN